MKNFKQDKEKGVSFITESGEPVNLSWNDFWELARESDVIDAEQEVLAAIEEMEDYEDGRYDKIEEDRELRLKIVSEVLHSRCDEESLSQVYDAIKKGLAGEIR